jgi:hypothetical protein
MTLLQIVLDMENLTIGDGMLKIDKANISISPTQVGTPRGMHLEIQLEPVTAIPGIIIINSQFMGERE